MASIILDTPIKEFPMKILSQPRRPVDHTRQWHSGYQHLPNSASNHQNIPWPISELMGDSDYAENYDNGIWMQSFLGPTDYHRQHAPVSGTVVEAKVIPGLSYLNVISEPDSQGNNVL